MTHQMWLYFVCAAIVLNAVGYFWQSLSIFNKRSGEAVSVAWFASSIGLEVVNLFYGWSRSDALFIANALICIVGQGLVLLTLRIYKPFGKREKIVIFSMLATIVAALVLPFKTVLQMLAQAINLYGGADQPVELKGAKDRGALELLSIVLSGVSALIWTAYCWAHFGFWGPAAGFLGYSVYSAYMICQWCQKPKPSKSW